MAFLTPAELMRVQALRPELRAVVLPIMQATEDATGCRVSIPPRGAVRSFADQQALYDAWQRGEPGIYQPATPGNSRHEYGAAVDLNLRNGRESDYARMAQVANTYGLDTGFPDDPVHMQLRETLEQSKARWAALSTTRSSVVKVIAAGLVLVGMLTNSGD